MAYKLKRKSTKADYVNALESYYNSLSPAKKRAFLKEVKSMKK